MKHFSVAIIITTVFLLVGCKQTKEAKTPNAQALINKAIEISGGSKLENSDIKFKFRKGIYTAKRNHGRFEYTATYTRKDTLINEILTNKDYKLFKNNEPVIIPDSLKTKFSGGVNSVHYFSVLPFGLNDKAVNKEYTGNATIKNNDYHQIKVSFNKEGGGTDFEDVFMYWVNTKTHKVDYLAYKYKVNNGGIRFREAKNERFIKNIRFVDYNNYKTVNLSTKLEELPNLFANNKLQLVSEINIENIEVK